MKDILLFLYGSKICMVDLAFGGLFPKERNSILL